jgi:hypothetical protein
VCSSDLDELRKNFKDSSIRTLNTHCKFILITNEEWNIVVRSSMNLNESPRMENLEISNDKAFCDFMISLTDEIFKTGLIGDFSNRDYQSDSVKNVEIDGEIPSKSIHSKLNFPKSGSVKYGNSKTLFD